MENCLNFSHLVTKNGAFFLDFCNKTLCISALHSIKTVTPQICSF